MRRSGLFPISTAAVDWSVAPRHFILAFLATKAVSLTPESQASAPASFCRIRPTGCVLMVVAHAPIFLCVCGILEGAIGRRPCGAGLAAALKPRKRVFPLAGG